MSKISTHVLDTERGNPVSGMEITLFKIVEGERIQLSKECTNQHGRVDDLCSLDRVLESGAYCLHFFTETYFLQGRSSVFYPYVEVVFNIDSGQENYHIPLILSSFGYSTYRGS